MEKNKYIKKFINCFLFENIERVTKEFISLMKVYRICEIAEYTSKGKGIYSVYENQLLDFFNGILQDEPLRHTQELMLHWKNAEIHSNCNLHPVLPEDIIAYYTVLKETLFHLIIQYADDKTNTEALTNELNDLEAQIQSLVAETFKDINHESSI